MISSRTRHGPGDGEDRDGLPHCIAAGGRTGERWDFGRVYGNLGNSLKVTPTPVAYPFRKPETSAFEHFRPLAKMKRLDKHQSKVFGPLRMRPSDLKEIFSLLDGRNGLQLVADDIQYDSLEEFVGEYAGRTPKSLSIKIYEPHLHVALTRTQSRLYASSSDIEACGLFSSVDRILKRCERKPRLLYSLWGATSILSFVFLSTYLLAFNSQKIITLLIQAIVWLWFNWVFFVNLRRHSLIQTDNSTSLSFWKRNSDNIVVALIAALIGATVGAFATKFVDHYFPGASSSPAALSHSDSKRDCDNGPGSIRE